MRDRPSNKDRRAGKGQALPLAVAAGVLTLGAVALWSKRPRDYGYADSAPGRTARRRWFNDMAVVGRSVTITKPRAEMFAYWRDFANLPQFMENVEAVEVDGDLTTWTIRAPAGSTVQVKTRIVAEKQGEQITWRSVEGSDIETEGKVMFRDAPGDRGTEVEALIAYRPPAGAAGRMIATLFQAEPAIQSRRDLKRFKMLMETGEVATSRNRRSEQDTDDRGGR
jgi:uncharacterized membrane protein